MTKLIRIILVGFFFLIVGLEIALYIIYTKNETSQGFQFPLLQQPTATPTPSPSLSLTLIATSSAVTENQTYTLHVITETHTNNKEKPTIIQLEIAYDPNALSQVSITPGTYFDAPQVLLNNINTHTGRISYALSGKEINETGSIATISVTKNPAFPDVETSLSFLPKSMIKGITDTNLLMATYGTKLYFASGSALLNH